MSDFLFPRLNEEDLKLLATPQVSVVADYVKVLEHKLEMVLSLSNYVVPDGGESYPIDIEESRGDKLGPVVFNAESKNESTSTSVKRKSIDQRAVVGNNDVLRRQSKWNSGALKVPELQDGNIVGSITPMDPFKPVSKLNFSRFDSRGTITNFSMDHIKTYRYVSYSSVEEAIEYPEGVQMNSAAQSNPSKDVRTPPLEYKAFEDQLKRAPSHDSYSIETMEPSLLNSDTGFKPEPHHTENDDIRLELTLGFNPVLHNHLSIEIKFCDREV
ncbi:unnamed protein product [Fraxinus pennsylvanica]|uniref:Uncharacterized protein n=1 Tax=Fraxinus pennsylvanica TaxID=56036 RepID=A0AAD1ZFD2_9LAMI|nr:unnamed protein product [Fraxinus pennsylvanica]